MIPMAAAAFPIWEGAGGYNGPIGGILRLDLLEFNFLGLPAVAAVPTGPISDFTVAVPSGIIYGVVLAMAFGAKAAVLVSFR
jgi:hypothetical protein